MRPHHWKVSGDLLLQVRVVRLFQKVIEMMKKFFQSCEENALGSIYVEAADKVTLKKVRDITFVNAKDVLGIIYNSKSGNTSLKWRQIRHNSGKASGEASSNSLVNLAQSGVITLDWVENYVKKKIQEN